MWAVIDYVLGKANERVRFSACVIAGTAFRGLQRRQPRFRVFAGGVDLQIDVELPVGRVRVGSKRLFKEVRLLDRVQRFDSKEVWDRCGGSETTASAMYRSRSRQCRLTCQGFAFIALQSSDEVPFDVRRQLR